MAYLSREDIERFAEPLIARYKQAFVPEHHLCYHVDPSALAALLGFRIEYIYLTQDGSILGQTASDAVWTTVFDENMHPVYFLLDGSTILIKKRLLHPKSIGRKNFTNAHELAHQLINRAFPGFNSPQCRVHCDYRRTAEKPVTDCYEWQADALAAALLLPPDALSDAMFLFGLGARMKVLSRKYSQTNYDRFCEMAEFLQVSKTALAYRMEHLGLLERNLLLREAPTRKGA